MRQQLLSENVVGLAGGTATHSIGRAHAILTVGTVPMKRFGKF
jgi:hypothetical protein